MGLVEDHGVVLAEEATADAGVQAVEVHVGDDQLRLAGPLEGPFGQAGVAVVARRRARALPRTDGDEGPQADVDRDGGIGEVAGTAGGGRAGTAGVGRRRLRPLGQGEQRGPAVIDDQLALVAAGGFGQLGQAEVVRPALQDGRIGGRRQDPGHERDVLADELVLERLAGGGDDDALARECRRHQVGERLSDAGTGFDDEVAASRQGVGDGLTHVELGIALLAVGKAGDEGRQRLTGGASRCRSGHRCSLADGGCEGEDRRLGFELGRVRVPVPVQRHGRVCVEEVGELVQDLAPLVGQVVGILEGPAPLDPDARWLDRLPGVEVVSSHLPVVTEFQTLPGEEDGFVVQQDDDLVAVARR